MSLLQMLSLAWGISGREVQRTLARGVPGFRRVGRGHYRAAGPITAARLGRVRPLDPRLPVAVWLSGGCTLWAAARLCSGAKISEAITRAEPHMREARIVMLALETRMARQYRATRRGYYLRRQETAVTFNVYRPKIEAELGMAEMQPRFVEAANSARRIINSGTGIPTRADSAADLGISERTHFKRYGRRTWRRALDSGASFVEAKEAVEVLLGSIERLAEFGSDCTPDEVAEELGYDNADTMFTRFTRKEYEQALARFDSGAISRAVSKQHKAKDTGQEGRRAAHLKDSGAST